MKGRPMSVSGASEVKAVAKISARLIAFVDSFRGLGAASRSCCITSPGLMLLVVIIDDGLLFKYSCSTWSCATVQSHQIWTSSAAPGGRVARANCQLEPLLGNTCFKDILRYLHGCRATPSTWVLQESRNHRICRALYAQLSSFAQSSHPRSYETSNLNNSVVQP